MFAGLAVVLAAVGVYGVIGHTVSQRTREIGIRLSLGARNRDVLRLVVGEGMVPVCFGLLAGLVGALAVGRLLSGLLFGIEPADPVSFAVGLAILCIVGLAACTLPAWRASRTTPVDALRD